MGIEEELAKIERELKEASAEPEAVVTEETPAPEEVIGEPPASEPEKEEVKEPEAEETEAADEGEAEPEKEAKDYVKERRQSRKEMERELLEARAKLAALEAIQQQKAAEAAAMAAKKPEPEPEQAPNRDEDPDAYRDWVIAQQSKALNQTQEELKKIAAANLAAKAKEELAAVEQEYAKVAPDYQQVMDFAYGKMMEEARLDYPNATEAQIRQLIDFEKLKEASMYAQKGLNPAEVIYKRMKIRYGQPHQAKQATLSDADKLKAVAKNKSMAVSGMTAKTGGNNPALSKEALKRMTPAEYAKLSSEERKLFDTLN